MRKVVAVVFTTLLLTGCSTAGDRFHKLEDLCHKHGGVYAVVNPEEDAPAKYWCFADEQREDEASKANNKTVRDSINEEQ